MSTPEANAFNIPLVEASPSSLSEELSETKSVPYDALTQLLSHENSQRAVLYIPKPWLPTERTPAYQTAFKDAWWSVLRQPDQRADFVDGDIGERNDGDFRAQVTKAAHLTPWLLENNLVTRDELRYAYEHTNSSVVRESFEDLRRTATPTHRPSEHDTPQRRAWINAVAERDAIRVAAYDVTPETLPDFQASRTDFETSVALQSIVRLTHLGSIAANSAEEYMAETLLDERAAVRTQGEKAYRQLYHDGHLSEELLHDRKVEMHNLSGALSENIQAELPVLAGFVEQLSHHTALQEVVYPALAVGGSRLKGYADSFVSDQDVAVFIRPNKRVDAAAADALRGIFHETTPLLLQLEKAATTLRFSDTTNDWSTIVHQWAWVGGESLREELATSVASSFSLRRLEQEALQYRLLHKGFEQQYVRQIDIAPIAADTIGSQSTFWDTQYRALAVRLFAEKVRLPR